MKSAPQRNIPEESEVLVILFRIVGRRSWDELQSWHRALPGSHVEYVLFGIYALVVEPGGTKEIAA